MYRNKVTLLILFLIGSACSSQPERLKFGSPEYHRAQKAASIKRSCSNLVGKRFFRKVDIDKYNSIIQAQSIEKRSDNTGLAKLPLYIGAGYISKSGHIQVKCLERHSHEVFVGCRNAPRYLVCHDRDQLISEGRVNFINKKAVRWYLTGSTKKISLKIDPYSYLPENGQSISLRAADGIRLRATIINRSKKDIQLNAIADSLTFAMGGRSLRANLMPFGENNYPEIVLRNTKATFTIELKVDPAVWMVQTNALETLIKESKSSKQVQKISKETISAQYRLGMPSNNHKITIGIKVKRSNYRQALIK